VTAPDRYANGVRLSQIVESYPELDTAAVAAYRTMRALNLESDA
jgi:hypothetical protein